jgi:hypothetical protein
MTIAGGARATRKPRLLFRFAGVFPLRYADRQFLAEFLQLPPRFTRFEPYDHSPLTVLTPAAENANWLPRPPG